MQQRRTATASFVMVVLLVLLTPAALQTYAGIGVRIVRTGSMTPVMSPGDAVIVRATPVTELAVGDVALLFHPLDGEVAAHRILGIEPEESAITVRTKGDANPAADAPVQLPRTAIIERVAMVVPAAGYALQFLGSTVVLVSCFALGLLALIALGIHNRRLPAASESNT